MRQTKIERTAHFFSRMAELGFSYSEAQSLRRIEMTLQRWGELECGDGNDYCSWSIERDEATDKPYRVTYDNSGRTYKVAIPDREKGALARLARIMAKHPTLWAYHQPDCRGCNLYIGRYSDMPAEELENMEPKLNDYLGRLYTRGFAVCI